MISSQALKSFVKSHERKLDAKIREAREDMAVNHNTDLESAHWGNDCIDGRHDTHIRQVTSHWPLNKAEITSSHRRPKQRDFNFILTPIHQ